MISDALVAFVPIGSPLSLIGAAGAAIPSGVIDLLGQGVGTAPQNIIGTRSTFGTDMGIGDRRPEINVAIGTAIIAASSSTLKIALQAAADQGAGGAYQPSTWTDIVSEDGITAANLVAGAVPFRVPFLPTFPPGLMPRYLRLLFSISSLGAFSAGSVASATVTRNRDDQANKYSAKNFTVA